MFELFPFHLDVINFSKCRRNQALVSYNFCFFILTMRESTEGFEVRSFSLESQALTTVPPSWMSLLMRRNIWRHQPITNQSKSIQLITTATIVFGLHSFCFDKHGTHLDWLFSFTAEPILLSVHYQELRAALNHIRNSISVRCLFIWHCKFLKNCANKLLQSNYYTLSGADVPWKKYKYSRGQDNHSWVNFVCWSSNIT